MKKLLSKSTNVDVPLAGTNGLTNVRNRLFYSWGVWTNSTRLNCSGLLLFSSYFMAGVLSFYCQTRTLYLPIPINYWNMSW